jgi:hypothetical protein
MSVQPVVQLDRSQATLRLSPRIGMMTLGMLVLGGVGVTLAMTLGRSWNGSLRVALMAGAPVAGLLLGWAVGRSVDRRSQPTVAPPLPPAEGEELSITHVDHLRSATPDPAVTHVSFLIWEETFADLSMDDLRTFFAKYPQMTHLEILDMRQESFGRGATELAQILGQCRALGHLKLYCRCDLSELAQLLPALTYLEAFEHHTSDEQLAVALSHWTQLRHVALLRLGVAGIKALVDHCPQVTDLVVERVPQQGFDASLQQLSRHPSLRRLEWCGCPRQLLRQFAKR